MANTTRRIGAWVMTALFAAAMMVTMLAYSPSAADARDRGRCHGHRHASINDGNVRARCGNHHSSIKNGHVRTHSKHRHASIHNGNIRTHR